MRHIAIVALLATLGCTDVFGPNVTMWGRRPLEPVPEVYGEWYADVEACLGEVGNFGAIVWFVADALRHEAVGEAWGLITGDEITIRHDHLSSQDVVRHEMVHHILDVGIEAHNANGNLPCEWPVVS